MKAFEASKAFIFVNALATLGKISDFVLFYFFSSNIPCKKIRDEEIAER